MNREPEALLGEEDGAAYRRFIEWSPGAGFDLAIVEVATRSKRDALVAWTKQKIPGARVIPLDQVGPDKQRLWDLLGKPTSEGALILQGLEEAEAQDRIIAQLNVERDELVKAFPLPWILLVHPHAAKHLTQRAPDFCDFAGVWLWEEAPEPMRAMLAAIDAPRMASMPTAIDATGPGKDLLVRAWNAVNAWRLDEARDLLSQFDVKNAGAAKDPFRKLVEGGILWARGQLAAARAAFSEARRGYEALDDQPGIAASLHGLAGVLRAQGDLAGARQRLERALAIYTKVLGTEEHPNVAASLHSLAGVLRAQGDLAGARQRLERALAIYTKVLGTEEHPNVAASLHSLAVVLMVQGDLAGARQWLERALAIYSKVLGTEEYPNVATSLHELGVVLRAQGDLVGARERLERALAIYSKVLGTEEHPNVAGALHELAVVLMAQGDLAGARQRLERSLAIYSKVLGTEEHPDVAASLHGLAGVLMAQGDLAGARQRLERALEIEEHVHGTRDHSSTAITEVSLAMLLVNLGEMDRARELLAHAWRVSMNQLGSEHPQTQQIGAWLAQL